MKKCMICGVVFDKPATHVYQGGLNGFPFTQYEYACPCCGNSEAYFEDVKAENGNIFMRELAEFLSQYTPEQIAEVDRALDGESVEDFIKKYAEENA